MIGLAYLLVGIVLGAAVTWFIARSRFTTGNGVTQEEFILVDKEKAVLSDRINQLTDSAKKSENNLADEKDKNLILSEKNARLEQEQKNLLQKLSEQKEEVNKLQEKFSIQFKNLANEIFEEKSKKFTEQNQKNLDQVLTPFKDRIREFQDKVEKVYNDENKERITLKTEIKSLVELNKQLSEEANNLAVAIKGDTKQQGDWGEMVLEKILERSGLIKGLEYKTQVVTTNPENERIKPDVVVFLPEEKNIIIDSKVSLSAYTEWVNAKEESEKESFLKQHLNSVYSHIKLLSDKNYQAATGLTSPDFVLLFMPFESAFSAALQSDNDLFTVAWDKRIVIVSPTTLLATLKTVASIWKQERQTRNALQIADEGGKLYDKFVSFIEDLITIGKKLDEAKINYAEAMKKLHEGSGNLVRRAEKMKELGAKTTKSLSPSLIERAND